MVRDEPSPVQPRPQKPQCLYGLYKHGVSVQVWDYLGGEEFQA